MDNDIWISYNFYMSQKYYLIFWLFSTIKKFLAHKPYKKRQ